MRRFIKNYIGIAIPFLIFASYLVEFTKIEQSATAYSITYANAINFPIVIGLYLLTLMLFLWIITPRKLKILAISTLTIGNLVFFPRLIRQEFRLSASELTIISSGYVEFFAWDSLQSITLYTQRSGRSSTTYWKMTDKNGNIIANELENGLMEQSREITEQFATNHGVTFENQVNP
ncbi:hypothetical protein [Herpetosiphon geysericola]|uniref:Uncharacterized protein n=1 Tax=Herpetosiphon geysericola TaxID=70996 RepID=A0A0P6Y2M5_9CHLR|nr:hypothetical protein [Herpetosiphon geysericola]KPL83352.1 hypothetical protein SE18_19260 [Herpetosiphon geysericola]